MVRPSLLAGAVLLAALGGCGAGGAPSGAVTGCGSIRYLGSSANLRSDATAAHDSAICFVEAVRSCHAARLELDVMGVDTGAQEVLTVRRAAHHACVMAVADSSFVLGKTTRRHEVCRAITVASDGVSTSDCKRSG